MVQLLTRQHNTRRAGLTCQSSRPNGTTRPKINRSKTRIHCGHPRNSAEHFGDEASAARKTNPPHLPAAFLGWHSAPANILPLFGACCGAPAHIQMCRLSEIQQWETAICAGMTTSSRRLKERVMERCRFGNLNSKHLPCTCTEQSKD